MRLDYLLGRLGIFLLVVWVAATINFFIPRLGDTDPIRARLAEQAAIGGGHVTGGLEEMIAEYNKKFGLDRPLWEQYLTYLKDVSRLDFGYSITKYPMTVAQIMRRSIRWTIGLLGVTTLMSFVIGSFLGALLAWPKAPKFLNYLLPPFLALSAVPYYLLGLVLLYIFAFRTQWLPLFGGHSPTAIPQMSWTWISDVLRHGVLPAASIVVSTVGLWALGMRGMMVTVQGEDYMTFAEAKGLNNRTLFLRYGVRNAILPQITSLAISLGYILSGSILVEVVFGYPGIGLVLYQAIRVFDYFVIQGMVFMLIIGIALATLMVDLTLPLLDPRIGYRRA